MVGISSVVVSKKLVGVYLNGFGEVFNGLCMLLLDIVRISSIGVSLSIFGVEFNGFGKTNNGQFKVLVLVGFKALVKVFLGSHGACAN